MSTHDLDEASIRDAVLAAGAHPTDEFRADLAASLRTELAADADGDEDRTGSVRTVRLETRPAVTSRALWRPVLAAAAVLAVLVGGIVLIAQRGAEDGRADLAGRLAGRSWVALDAPTTRALPTLTFSELDDGRLQVDEYDGCNHGSGPITIVDGTVTASEILQTLAACGFPTGTGFASTPIYVGATLAVDGDRLTVTNPDVITMPTTVYVAVDSLALATTEADLRGTYWLGGTEVMQIDVQGDPSKPGMRGLGIGGCALTWELQPPARIIPIVINADVGPSDVVTECTVLELEPLTRGLLSGDNELRVVEGGLLVLTDGQAYRLTRTAGEPPPTVALTGQELLDALIGRTWFAVDGAVGPVGERPLPWVVFDSLDSQPNRISIVGSNGCNSYSGTITIAATLVTQAEVGSTDALCDGSPGDAVIPHQGAAIELIEGVLTITNQNGVTRYRPTDSLASIAPVPGRYLLGTASIEVTESVVRFGDCEATWAFDGSQTTLGTPTCVPAAAEYAAVVQLLPGPWRVMDGPDRGLYVAVTTSQGPLVWVLATRLSASELADAIVARTWIAVDWPGGTLPTLDIDSLDVEPGGLAFSGFDGCNQHEGPISIDDTGRIAAGEISITDQLCEGEPTAVMPAVGARLRLDPAGNLLTVARDEQSTEFVAIDSLAPATLAPGRYTMTGLDVEITDEVIRAYDCEIPWSADATGSISFTVTCVPAASWAQDTYLLLFDSPWQVRSLPSGFLVTLPGSTHSRLDRVGDLVDPIAEFLAERAGRTWIAVTDPAGFDQSNALRPFFTIAGSAGKATIDGFDGCTTYRTEGEWVVGIGGHNIDLSDATTTARAILCTSPVPAVTLEASAHFDVGQGPDELLVINRITGGGARFVALDSLLPVTIDRLVGSWQIDTAGLLQLQVTEDAVQLGSCALTYAFQSGAPRTPGWPGDPTTCVDDAAGASEADVSAASLALTLASGDVSLALDEAGNLYVSGSLGDFGSRHFVLSRSPT